MKIGIDISQVVYKGTGVGRFLEGLIGTICKYDINHEWVFFFSSFRRKLERNIRENIKTREFKLFQLPLPLAFLSALWNDLHIVPVNRVLGRLDWFITSDWIEPPITCKKATVIHDLTIFKYPETVDPRILKTQRKRLQWVSKESSLIFTDSDATKHDVKTYFPQVLAPIIRIYPGVEVPSVDINLIKTIRQKLNLKKDFILAVGKLEPRKNIPRLIEAFRKTNLPNTELVIVGGYGWGQRIRPQKKVKILGYVDDMTLHALYRMCLFFVYPSIWEGFGFPVVEAMKHGAPIATSNTSSLKEIVEGAGLLFNPQDVNDISHCIRLLATNKKLRNELKRKSLKRAEAFSWKTYYSGMIKNLENF